jgi:hypothetical protein
MKRRPFDTYIPLELHFELLFVSTEACDNIKLYISFHKDGMECYACNEIKTTSLIRKKSIQMKGKDIIKMS